MPWLDNSRSTCLTSPAISQWTRVPDNPTSRVDLQYDAVDLAAFFRGSRFFDTTNGKLTVRIVLAGSGRSLAQLMGAANGDIVMTMAGGSVSGLMVSLADLQLANALMLYITGDDRIPIRCAVGRLVFQHGAVAFDKTLWTHRSPCCTSMAMPR